MLYVKLESAAAGFGIEFGARRPRIKRVEQQQPGEKAANMGLPGDLLPCLGTHRHGTQAKKRIEPYPNHKEHQKPRIAQRRERAQGFAPGFCPEPVRQR